MTTQEYKPASWVGHNRDGSERGSCPPHTPILVEASKRGYVARCLVCGLRGQEREDNQEAKVAFDKLVEQSG